MSVSARFAVKSLRWRSGSTRAPNSVSCSPLSCLRPCHPISALEFPVRISMQMILSSLLTRWKNLSGGFDMEWSHRGEGVEARYNAGKKKVVNCQSLLVWKPPGRSFRELSPVLISCHPWPCVQLCLWNFMPVKLYQTSRTCSAMTGHDQTDLQYPAQLLTKLKTRGLLP